MARKRRKAATTAYTPVTRRDYEGWTVSIEIEGDVQAFPDYVRIARDYAERCVDGRQLVCRFVRLGAERFLTMMKKAEGKKPPFTFEPEHVIDVCSFIENLPHIEGSWDSPTIQLEPWQMWMLAAIYGFRRLDGTRLCRWVYAEVPRKSAKSTTLAGMALFGLTSEGENGPTVVIGSRTLEQAAKVFSPAAKMIRKDFDLEERFGLRPRARKIYCDDTMGAIELVTSVSEHQDGHNPHMVILDELHAQDPGLYDVMRSSFGARKNPLLVQITTAGRYAQGICWEQRKRVIRVLEGTETADEVFGIIYTIDKGDDPYSEIAMIKANPMWGVSVDPATAIEFVREAENNPLRRGEYLRTRVNVWSNASERLIQTEAWDICGDRKLRLEQFRGRQAWIGVDLASRRDMAAKVLIIEDDEDLVVFSNFYVPSDCTAFADPDLGGYYNSWRNAGHLTATGPGMIDFDMIEEDIREDCRFFDVKAIALDPYQAQQLAQALVKDGLPAVLFPNTAKNMTEPTNDVTSRVETGLLRHDGNPVLAWHASNVVGYTDQKGNVLPKKEAPNSPYKIDGIHALVFANGARLSGKEPDKRKKVRKKVYLVRGPHGASPAN